LEVVRYYDEDGKKNGLMHKEHKKGNVQSRNEQMEIGNKSDETMGKRYG